MWGEVIPPIEIQPDTEWVKRIRIKSELLSKFWGRDMYLGASILLPKGYEEHPNVHYPVVYYRGHFFEQQPLRFPNKKPQAPGAPQWIWDDLCERQVDTEPASSVHANFFHITDEIARGEMKLLPFPLIPMT